jgi:hypothetical protein
LYRLPGHSVSNFTAPVVLSVGEEVLAIRHGPALLERGYKLNLASEDPGVVDVLYDRNSAASSRLYIVGRTPGRTILHYGNLYTQVKAFAGSESARLNTPLPGLMGGTATPAQRARWLREHSDGAFPVTVR